MCRGRRFLISLHLKLDCMWGCSTNNGKTMYMDNQKKMSLSATFVADTSIHHHNPRVVGAHASRPRGTQEPGVRTEQTRRALTGTTCAASFDGLVYLGTNQWVGGFHHSAKNGNGTFSVIVWPFHSVLRIYSRICKSKFADNMASWNEVKDLGTKFGRHVVNHGSRIHLWPSFDTSQSGVKNWDVYLFSHVLTLSSSE